MSEILVKNGIIYDPSSKIDGEQKDIAVRDGKIVESVSNNAKIIDASNFLVLAGGVDIHSHIAGSKVNAGRILRPEDHYKDPVPKTNLTRAGVGYSVPSIFVTGYRYSKMGYTTVFEPATPPLKARHTLEELNDIPLLDKAHYPMFCNNMFVMEYLAAGKIEECAAYVAWVIEATKGYAIKIVNPGGVEAWGWGKNVTSLDDQVPHFNITPKEIIRGLCKVNKILNLPHTIHVHPNRLGRPGNYENTIKTMDCVRDLADGKPVMHMTHIQFEGYGGRDWLSLSSGASEIAKYLNGNNHVTLDLGQVIFTDTTTMTGDGPFQYQLHLLSGNKWTNVDVEAESGSGIVPFVYKKSNYVNAVQWAIGLEVCLLINDLWKVFLTTDHPNGGPFYAYPKVIAWLMSKKARDKITSKIPRMARKRTDIESIDRELTFYDIAIITRAATAKSLNLKQKGRLDIGADADIAIYPIKPREIDPSKDYKKVIVALKNAIYVLKDGEVVVKDKEINSTPMGRTFWVKPKIETDLLKTVTTELKTKFKDYYTVEMENYYIKEDYLVNPVALGAE